MIKKIMFLLFLSSLSLFAAKPIVQVGDLPRNSELELYEESEGLFANKLLELYKMGIALESQIRISGHVPEVTLDKPTFEEIEDMDIKTLKKFYKNVKTLESQVINMPDSDRQILLDKISDLENRLRDTIAIYTIEKGAIRNQMLDLMLQRLREIEKQNSENIELVINQNYVNCMDYNTWFSIAGVSKVLISDGLGIVTNDPGIGAQFSLNIGKITGFWNGFELKYEYLAPKLFTEYDYGVTPIVRDQWNSNLNSVMGGGKIEINKTKDLIQAFNLFVGYFWTDGRIYNKSGSYMNWDGGVFSLDYSLAVPSCKFPLELFGGISIYHSFSRKLLLQTPVSGFENIELNKTHVALNIGLKYNLWRTPF